MKILFVNHFPLTGSGSGVYTANLAKSLRDKGHECAIIFPDNRKEYEKYDEIELYPVFFKNKETIFGVGQADFNFPCFTTHPRSTFTYKEMTDEQWEIYEQMFRDKINEVINEFKPDIVHAQHVWALAGISAECCKEKGLPMVVTCHGTDLLGIMNEIERGVHRGSTLAAEAADYSFRIVSISTDNTALMNELLPEYKDKVEIIRNGADGSIFHKDDGVTRESVLSGLGVDTKYKKVVCFVGKLTPMKNVEGLLRAAVYYETPEVVTLIAGDGELREKLEALTEELGLKNIKFLGNQPHDILSKIYNIADCSTILSKREAFGLVAIEAMMCGAPLIASDHGALPEFVTEDVGILVDADKPKDIADAINTVLKGDKVFDRDHVAQKISGIFSQDAIIHEFENVYEQAISGC